MQVEVVRDGQAEEVATNGKQRWLLSPSTTLRLTMSQASTEASSDKVPWLRGVPPGSRGHARTEAGLVQGCPIEAEWEPHVSVSVPQ